MIKKLLAAAAFLAAPLPLTAQQVPDLAADTRVAAPVYVQADGPLVLIDGAHNNFHTAGEGFAPFAQLLGNDGYRIQSLDMAPITEEALAKADILVIANPLATENVGNWRLPTPPAFTGDEVTAIRAWVEGGGSLLLIADHMPFGGAANNLAQAFGFEFANSFARDARAGPERFSRANRRLTDNTITRGEAKGKPVANVMSFTGSAFSAPAGAIPLMTLDSGFTILSPTVAWQFGAGTPRRRATSTDLRGAAMDVGKGRIAIFAEAAMFTAQRAGPRNQPMGFNAPTATQNRQYLLNVMHWLSRAQ